MHPWHPGCGCRWSWGWGPWGDQRRWHRTLEVPEEGGEEGEEEGGEDHHNNFNSDLEQWCWHCLEHSQHSQHSRASIAEEPHDLHATCHLGRHQAEWQGRFRSFLGWAGHRYCPSGRSGSWISLDKSGVKVVLVEFPSRLVFIRLVGLVAGCYIAFLILRKIYPMMYQANQVPGAAQCTPVLSILALRIPPGLLLSLLSPLLTFKFCLSAAADRHATSWSWWVCCWCWLSLDEGTVLTIFWPNIISITLRHEQLQESFDKLKEGRLKLTESIFAPARPTETSRARISCHVLIAYILLISGQAFFLLTSNHSCEDRCQFMSAQHTSSTDPDVTLTATMVAQAAHSAKQVSLRQ